MQLNSIPLGVLTAFALTSPAWGQTAVSDDAPAFAPPVQLQAASGPLKVARQAGPHYVDFDQDGAADMLLGDVMGWVFIAKGLGDGSTAAYADPVRVLMADGTALKFHNW